MLTAGLNSLALVRFGGFRFSHGGGSGGFAWLLIGLVAIAAGIWFFSRTGENAHAKN
jgi:hypothetical protein